MVGMSESLRSGALGLTLEKVKLQHQISTLGQMLIFKRMGDF